MNQPLIELASLADAQAVAELHKASLNASHAELLPGAVRDLVLGTSEARPRWGGWSGWIRRSQAITLVARSEGEVLGFLALHPVLATDSGKMVAEVAALFVAPTVWRQGIGGLLLERAEREAAAKGLHEIVLWVLEANFRARRFYEGQGFRADGRTRVFLESREGTLFDLRYRKSGRQKATDPRSASPRAIDSGRPRAGDS